MAKIAELTEEEQRTINDWIESLPEPVRRVAKDRPPELLYRMKDGHRVTIYSYEETENGARVTVLVTGQYNHVAFERKVFGIDPYSLTECELPVEGETLGSLGLLGILTD